MKKTINPIVSLALLFLLFASSSNINETETRVGAQVPNFTVSNNDTTLSLQDARGKYVIVTFWSSTVPESRIDNMRHDRTAKNNSKLAHIAINYDTSRGVFNEICKLDNLDSYSQFYGGNETGMGLLTVWHQEDGFTSILIDPTGKVLALNPTDELLTAF